ncbi:MAG: hypothetical protein PWP03_566 [Candidatus Woesearchaeota archaeon]|nr:hypothetical protein [Candidatus Woesearchaeota archaeon]MDN5327928.1 hypothetical protein [Candidatus Woesearchaeota archaeon]
MLKTYINHVKYVLNMDWDLLGLIIGSKIRFEILSLLKEGIMTPTQISKKTKRHISSISRALKELKEYDLVILLNNKRSRNSFYSITEKGKFLLRQIEEKISFIK